MIKQHAGLLVGEPQKGVAGRAVRFCQPTLLLLVMVPERARWACKIKSDVTLSFLSPTCSLCVLCWKILSQ